MSGFSLKTMFFPLRHVLLGGFSRGLSTNVKYAHSRYDMVIVGGGMVGIGLAALAACSNILCGKRILLLEGSPKKPYHLRDQYETRVVALSCASQSMLHELNAWEFVTSKRAQPVTAMKVWEDQSDAFLVFECNPLAHIVENDLITEALRIVVEQQPSGSVTIEYGAQAEQIDLPSSDQPDQLARIQVRSARDTQPWTVETNLVIGADGVQSKVRQVAGLKTIGWDHGQAAVVATICLDAKSEPFTAWQRFVPNGPIALLPLSAEHASLVWSTTKEEADHLLTIPEAEFVQALNHALTKPSRPLPPESRVLGQLGQLMVGALDRWCGQTMNSSPSPPTPPHIYQLQSGTKRAVFPLGFQHANDYHASRCVLVGDAAHRILPLAGQGVNLGFGDAISLIHWLEEAVAQGADLGSRVFLQEYTTERQRAVVPVAATMELLNLLYSTDALAVKVAQIMGHDRSSSSTLASFAHQVYTRVLTSLRSAGLNTVQSSALIKKFLMNAAITGQIGVSPSDL